MFEYCQPNRLPDGRETAWGTVDPEQLFGPQGWCNAPEPQHLCACIVDGGLDAALGATRLATETVGIGLGAATQQLGARTKYTNMSFASCERRPVLCCAVLCRAVLCRLGRAILR